MILIKDFSNQNIYFEEGDTDNRFWIGKIKSYLPDNLKKSSLNKIKCLYIIRHRAWIYGIPQINYSMSKPNDEIDIFKFIKEEYIEKLKYDKNYIIMLDDLWEGDSSFMFYFFNRFYYNCKKYSISPEKILFISSNLKIKDSLNDYNIKNEINESIKVWAFPYFELYISNLSKKNLYPIPSIEQIKRNFKLTFDGKLFSSLSRINRHWRSIGTYLLSNSNMAEKGLISHNQITKQYQSELKLNLITYDEDFDNKKFKRWCKKLPLIIDIKNFSINQADNLNKEIHDQTLFQIVNETLVEDWNYTSLFYSEKTYKPIIHLQPFLIWGQQGCNRYLENMGYKLYTDWFDYSFDDEPNRILRYKKLLQSIEKAITEIENMNPDHYVNWRFKNTDVLEHNLSVLLNCPFMTERLNEINNILLPLTE